MVEAETVPSSTHYVTWDTIDGIKINPTVTPRPLMSIVTDRTAIPADGSSVAKITGIPAGATLTLDGDEHTVEDGEVDLTADHVGDYALSFSLFPYVPFSLTITGTQP